jgi:salicylate hydroxylase
MTTDDQFTPLTVAIIGGGLGGFAAAIALRRQGHTVTVYEKRNIAAEVGNSISCAKSQSSLYLSPPCAPEADLG